MYLVQFDTKQYPWSYSMAYRFHFFKIQTLGPGFNQIGRIE